MDFTAGEAYEFRIKKKPGGLKEAHYRTLVYTGQFMGKHKMFEMFRIPGGEAKESFTTEQLGDHVISQNDESPSAKGLRKNKTKRVYCNTKGVK